MLGEKRSEQGNINEGHCHDATHCYVANVLSMHFPRLCHQWYHFNNERKVRSSDFGACACVHTHASFMQH